MNKLLHPKLSTLGLANYWPSLCTIQQIGYTANASNQNLPTSAVTVEGMLNIPCSLGAPSKLTVAYNEKRQGDIIAEFYGAVLKLSGYFPTIVIRTMQAVVDGTTYQIRSVEHDSLNQFTRLKLEIVSV